MDWLDLLAVQGTLKSLLHHHNLKASILQCSAFFMVQLSHSCMTTGKTIVLTIWMFLVKAMVFLLVMYGCESCTIKKAECRRTDAFELWCFRRLLRVSWTTRRSKQSILKEISLEYSLEWVNLTQMIIISLESPLDCKDIQPVHPKGDQSWVFIGRK